MKKFLFKTTLFFCLLIGIDRGAGIGFSYMVAHAKGGDNGRNNYICNQADEDVLVFGSSRAIHHYNPKIISDSLGMTCYNCGQDGNGSILNYGRLQLIYRRYCPKMVIYDVMPKYDLLAGEDNHRFLGWLRAYYDRPGIADIFEHIDSTEKYKMQSYMYRYNTKFIQIVSDYISPKKQDEYQGFRPLDKDMDSMKITTNSKNTKIQEFDDVKIDYLKRFIELSSNHEVKVVVVISPIYMGMDVKELRPIVEYCNKKDVLLIDYSNHPKYLHNNRYFCDGGHMNAKGADEFSKDLTKEIKLKVK